MRRQAAELLDHQRRAQVDLRGTRSPRRAVSSTIRTLCGSAAPRLAPSSRCGAARRRKSRPRSRPALTLRKSSLLRGSLVDSDDTLARGLPVVIYIWKVIIWDKAFGGAQQIRLLAMSAPGPASLSQPISAGARSRRWRASSGDHRKDFRQWMS
jgi:hypothetical protein